MKAPKNTKKPMIIYGLIVLIALVMINYILMPSLFSTPTADIDYKSFLTLVKSGQVDTVEIGDTYLSALVRDKSGQSVIYRTGLITIPSWSIVCSTQTSSSARWFRRKFHQSFR